MESWGYKWASFSMFKLRLGCIERNHKKFLQATAIAAITAITGTLAVCVSASNQSFLVEAQSLLTQRSSICFWDSRRLCSAQSNVVKWQHQVHFRNLSGNRSSILPAVVAGKEALTMIVLEKCRKDRKSHNFWLEILNLVRLSSSLPHKRRQPPAKLKQGHRMNRIHLERNSKAHLGNSLRWINNTLTEQLSPTPAKSSCKGSLGLCSSVGQSPGTASLHRGSPFQSFHWKSGQGTQ